MDVEIKEENVHLIMFSSYKRITGYEVPISLYEHAIQPRVLIWHPVCRRVGRKCFFYSSTGCRREGRKCFFYASTGSLLSD